MKNFDNNVDKFKLELAKTIKEARSAMTITQSALSTISATPQAEISRIENGHLLNVSLEKLLRIAAAMEVEISVNFKGKSNCPGTGIDIEVTHVSFHDYRKKG